MSTNNTRECTELNNISKGLYSDGSDTPKCSELSILNTMIRNNSVTANGTRTPSCTELSNLNNVIKNTNTKNIYDYLNIYNIENLKIMDYSGAPIYILLLIAIIANIFLAIPLTPVFIAGFLYIIILIFILAMLCIYLIHMLLFQN
jgi:hypothetical protein